MQNMFISDRKLTYGPTRPITGIALIFICRWCSCLRGDTLLWASTACYRDRVTFLYVDGVRTWQETHLRAFSASYRYSLFLYIDDVRTWQETRLRASMACYDDRLTLLFMVVMAISLHVSTWNPLDRFRRHLAWRLLTLEATRDLLFVEEWLLLGCYAVWLL
jgi:hypothetical protein